jgi:hypothetical protein
LSEKTVCQWRARFGQEFFDGQLRDICLNAQAVAQKFDEQNPLTVETIIEMIINTPTEELDTLLQFPWRALSGCRRDWISAAGSISTCKEISAMLVMSAGSF